MKSINSKSAYYLHNCLPISLRVMSPLKFWMRNSWTYVQIMTFLSWHKILCHGICLFFSIGPNCWSPCLLLPKFKKNDYVCLSVLMVSVLYYLQSFIVWICKAKTVDQLLQLPLTDQEEKHLIEYLSTTTEAYGKELLVMYYLQRARYVEAIRLNEKLKQAALVSWSMNHNY